MERLSLSLLQWESMGLTQLVRRGNVQKPRSNMKEHAVAALLMSKAPLDKNTNSEYKLQLASNIAVPQSRSYSPLHSDEIRWNYLVITLGCRPSYRQQIQNFGKNRTAADQFQKLAESTQGADDQPLRTALFALSPSIATRSRGSQCPCKHGRRAFESNGSVKPPPPYQPTSLSPEASLPRSRWATTEPDKWDAGIFFHEWNIKGSLSCEYGDPQQMMKHST